MSDTTHTYSAGLVEELRARCAGGGQTRRLLSRAADEIEAVAALYEACCRSRRAYIDEIERLCAENAKLRKGFVCD